MLNNRFKKRFDKRIKQSGDFWIERQPAKLGNYSDVVEVPGAESMVYARLINGQVVTVFNNRVPNNPHLDVWIGTDKSEPTLWQVLQEWAVHDSNQVPNLVTYHHEQHEYPSPDTVWVRTDQFMALNVLPAGEFKINLYGGIVYRFGMDAPIRVANQVDDDAIDLVSYAIDAGAKYVLMEILEDGTPNFVEGSVLGSIEILESEGLPIPSAGAFPIFALIFHEGQTELRRDNDTRTIIDLRQFTSDVASASATAIATLGSPDVDQLQEYIDSTGSAGWFSGGELTDSGSGQIDIAAGAGFIRATTTNIDPLLSFEWSAVTNVSIPTDTTRYVYISYNSGSPTYVLSASEFDEEPDKILIGVAVNEGGSIESVFNVGVRLAESIGNAGRFIRNVLGISRDQRRGGLQFGQSGTRNVTLTEGSLWWGRTRYPISALDTSVTGSFDTYYYNGSAWVKSAAQTQWPNTQYNNIATGLVTMTNNRWANLWAYIEPDNHVVFIYGRNQYLSQVLAEEEDIPATLPPRLSATGILAARFVFEKSASTASISSAFDTLFSPSIVSDHATLSNLQGGTTAEYYHLTSAQHTDLTDGGETILHSHAGGAGEPLVFDDLTSQVPDGADHFDLAFEAGTGLILFFNGVFQPDTEYTMDGDNLGFTTDFSPEAGDTLVAIYGGIGAGGGEGSDTSAIHDNESGEINALTEKAVPVAGDYALIEDSEDAFTKKKINTSKFTSPASNYLLSKFLR